MTGKYKPMLAREADKPFTDKDWIFEVKWDGFRALAYVNEDLSLRSRNGKELRYNFPELEELKQQAHNVVLDGEIVILNEGKVNFQAMLERGRAVSPAEIEFRIKRAPAVYVVFDILEKDGKPLLDLPLTERKKILKTAVQEGEHVLIQDFVEEKGENYYRVVLEKGLEGVMAKKKDSPYKSGMRSGNWLKIKKLRACDCVVFGYTKGTGARAKTFGALLLGLYNEERSPVYVGKVGTGFSQDTLEALTAEFKKLETDEAPFKADVIGEVMWVKPKLVSEVAYQVVTKDGRLRMPRFQRLRTDKVPSECTVDQLGDESPLKPLKQYLSKRDFQRTTEPKGGDEKKREVENKRKGSIFVVQEHHSRRLHYDFRLERDGVLKSWAVPKGIPNSPEEKRLAVETEDHPLEYAKFEGQIPKGEYGAGEVIIWDKGTYQPKVWDEKMVEFTLQGKKLTGRYVLVRLKRGGDKNWLMLKGKE
jgi:DNA ligase D-like protein (predicted ligase)/DNA ligase D-like protein (predicted 3'-phosphoesterase)